ncbi:multiheme c-type cytochrome [Thalassotalea euphylliae]|uniref:multiheme c-type cytochrome n=1 Tax=Thalassotalea euphylliae TaxID=1655234 RepID=UPI0021622C30|nr:multiheme c-type cytochrome [Thalassotalea euphylliae]
MKLTKFILTLTFTLISYHSIANQGNCVSCHQEQVSNWQKSDHAKAMAIANVDTVLANFNNVETTHYSQKAKFYRKNGKFLIDLTEAGETSSYEVMYTFGHYPLQQFLVPTQNGKYQVFPFAWDSRPSSEGGQRWYPNYANEDVKPNDRLHWNQPLQNWNGMCADCHSDGLQRNFSPVTNSFNTTWDNINVGCQSCHGNMPSEHAVSGQNNEGILLSNKEKSDLLNWLLVPGDKVARLRNQKSEVASQEQKAQRGQFMNTCFSCHALRTPLTDGFKPNKHLLEQFLPNFLVPPLYHADGQIKDEVYVYGSFLQSKMYDEGVNCLDCHDAHSMKVKTQTNGLCLQCHNAEIYEQEKHTNHPLDSKAGQCVSCHMPETTYMGVDARRDHSFKIPRPGLSNEFSTPNACISCHSDKNNSWAAEHLQTWFGKPQALSNSEQNYMKLMSNQELPLEVHLALINDDDMSEIKRATAIILLPYSTQMLTQDVVKNWVSSPLPLIRLATAQIGHLLPDNDKLKSYKVFLNDEFKAIRIAAANQLLTTQLKGTISYRLALKELLNSGTATAWRGEGLFNQALVDLKLQQEEKAIEKLEQSIEIDPYFAASYINLGDIYRSLKLIKEEQQLYKKALNNIPSSAEIQYSYGMFLIRSGDKASSIEHFKLAMKYDAKNPQYPYLYVLALDSVGNTRKALEFLKDIYPDYKSNISLRDLGLSFSQKLRGRESYLFFTQ